MQGGGRRGREYGGEEEEEEEAVVHATCVTWLIHYLGDHRG